MSEQAPRITELENALLRVRQGYYNILEMRKLTSEKWGQADGYGGRYGALTREEIEGVIAEIDGALGSTAHTTNFQGAATPERHEAPEAPTRPEWLDEWLVTGYAYDLSFMERMELAAHIRSLEARATTTELAFQQVSASVVDLRAVNQELLEVCKLAPCICKCDIHKSDWGFRDDVCLYVKRGNTDEGLCIRVVCKRCLAIAHAKGETTHDAGL